MGWQRPSLNLKTLGKNMNISIKQALSGNILLAGAALAQNGG